MSDVQQCDYMQPLHSQTLVKLVCINVVKGIQLLPTPTLPFSPPQYCHCKECVRPNLCPLHIFGRNVSLLQFAHYIDVLLIQDVLSTSWTGKCAFQSKPAHRIWVLGPHCFFKKILELWKWYVQI